MASFNYILARKLRKAKNKKQNGFTLIELMVVVAIVGVLTAVGLPQLSKSQDKAKDKAAIATLTNAAKECSLSLINNGDASDYSTTNGSTTTVNNPNFADIKGTCVENGTLGILSEGAEPGFIILLTETVPGIATAVGTAADVTGLS